MQSTFSQRVLSICAASAFHLIFNFGFAYYSRNRYFLSRSFSIQMHSWPSALVFFWICFFLSFLLLYFYVIIQFSFVLCNSFMLLATAAQVCFNKFIYISIGCGCAYHFWKCSSLHGHRPMSRAILRKMLSFCISILELLNRTNAIKHRARREHQANEMFASIWPDRLAQTTQSNRIFIIQAMECARLLHLVWCQPFLFSEWNHCLGLSTFETQRFDYLPFFCIRCLFILCLFVVHVAAFYLLPIAVLASPLLLFT